MTLRPEGTAPVVRAYLEHGMHKAPQPVKLWYLSSFFRYERPQAGRYRQFWQIGVEAIGSADPAVDAELILLLGELLEAIGAREVKLVLASSASPSPARPIARSSDVLRAHEDQLSQDVVDRIDLNPLRAFDAKHEPTRRDGERSAADRPAAKGRPRALRRGAGPAAGGRPRVHGRHDARARARLLHAHAVRVPVRRAGGGPEHVGGGGRYDGLAEAIGGPPTPGMGWAAGVERMLMASTQAAPVGRRSTSTSPTSPHKPAAFRLAADARRAGHDVRLELGGRSLKGQLKQASRSGARYVAIFGDDGVQLRDREGGEDKVVEPETVMHHIRGQI